MARKNLTDIGVRALKPRAARYTYPDPALAGHFLRVMPSGVKSFYAVVRDPQGKQQWVKTGSAETMPIEESRLRARAIIQRVRDGLPAIAPRAATFGAVVEEWRRRHVEKNGLRSAAEINRLLERHVLPDWRDRALPSIRKSDIAALLDRIEDGAGARQADYTLGIIRNLMNWHAARSDDFRPPIFRGMRRQSPHAQRRSRVLEDHELRAVWLAAETAGTYGALVRILLLTAQRREKVLTMRWDDVDADGVWTIPAEAREKQNAGVISLPAPARAIVAAQPRFARNVFVFAGRGEGPINGHSKYKDRLDQASGITGWTLHDLRRTARSLMSRAGVRPDIAERVMGHTITGVEGIYDRHRYDTEKADALAKLATLVDLIVNPQANVVAMGAHKKPRRSKNLHE